MIKKWGLLILLIAFFMQSSCDKLGEKKCEWYLMPEPRDQNRVGPGMVAVCARNFKKNKQRCQLQANFKFAKEVYGKKFRLADLEIDQSGKFPRTVHTLTPCSGP